MKTAIHPGRRLASLTIMVAIAAFLVWHQFIRTTRASVSDVVERATGHFVSCNPVGVMAVAGGRSNVYLCQGTVGTYRGCWADVGSNEITNVTKEARAIRTLGGVDFGC